MSSLYKHWRDQFNSRDDDLRIIICGSTRKGKSWRALKFGEELDPQFNIDQVVLDPYSFMDVLDEKSRPGSVIVGDEAGIWAYSRDWYSVVNKNLAKAFMTCGYLNQCYIMTLPSMKMLDSHVKTLFHYYVECLGISKRRNACKCIIKRIQHNPLLGKTYYKYIRLKHHNKTRVIRTAWISPPDSKELLEAYEKKNEEIKRASTAEGKIEMRREEEKSKIEWGKPRDVKGMIAKILKDPSSFLWKPGSVDADIVALEFDIGKTLAYRVKKGVESKLDR